MNNCPDCGAANPADIHTCSPQAEQPAQQEPVEWDAKQAYAEGRGDYEVVQIRAKKKGWKLFGDLSPEEQAYWVAKAAFDRASAPQPAQQQQEPVETESVLIDGVAYIVPMPVACEILRLYLEVKSAQPQQEPMTQEAFNQWFDALPWYIRSMWPVKPAQQEPVGRLRMGPRQDFVTTSAAGELEINVWHPVYTSPPVQPQEPLTVDCIGLALDLEAQAKRVESQTVERAMLAAANGLRIIAAHGIKGDA